MRQHRKQVNHVLRTALALLPVLALALLCAAPGWAVDLTQPCSVTVSLGSTEITEELRQAELVVDLYLVANAVASEEEDAFTFRLLAPYDTLSLDGAVDREGWNALAAQAMEIAQSVGTPVVSDAPVETAITQSNGGSPLTAGLYLMLVHGSGVDELAELSDGGRATVAYGVEHRFLFAPQLLSLPSKEAGEDGSISTAGPGEWRYDVTAYLKPELEAAYTSLQIVKTLRGYDANNPALFVFSVEAEYNGHPVYSDVLTMSFTDAGTQVVLVERLPIGAVVTVTEVYCGVGYTLVSAASQTVTLGVEQGSVSFVNDYVGSANTLRGIDNQFTFEETSGWGCVQILIPEY